ncbi:MAG: FtsX-like permease family protein, partial [bacterium]|nr:FtsX-like permease family protein [bacterium]
LITGNPENVLVSDNSIVLTESSAQKYFGDDDPIGKTLEIQVGQWIKLFEVAGIVENVPDNSTIEYDFVMNIRNLEAISGPDALTTLTWPRCKTYVLLKDRQNPSDIEGRMPVYVDQYFAEVEDSRRQSDTWNETGETIEFYLQNIKDIHLYTEGIAGERSKSVTKSYILAAIGLLVLFIAGINFTNLAIGRAATRVTEIGIRKILGADRRNLIRQFWAESIIVIMISAVFSILFAVMILPLFNDLANKNLQFANFINIQYLSIFALVILGLGFAAGSYPGLVLSSFQPVQIFKNKLRIGGRNVLTKALVVLQFSISIFLVIATLTMGKQINYIDQADLGYKKDNILVVETLEEDFSEGERVIKYFRNATENRNDVISVSGCVFSLGTYQGEGWYTLNGLRKHFKFSHVYYGYFETMGMEFVDGKGFSERFSIDYNEMVVNEEFVKQFKLENPAGMMISENTKITGVVKDFNYGSLKDEIEPVIHSMNPQGGLYTLLVKVTDDDIGNTISGMENIWKEIQPDKPFVYTFLNENLDRFYAEDKKWNSIVLYSSLFALIITCLGLVGITTLTVSRRIKEIGIKKVLGASVLNIVSLLSREFLFLVLVSNIIVWPVGYYIMSKWLQRFAFRIDIDMTAFFAAGLFAVLVAIVTISFQTIKAASADPVDTLRYE